MKKLLILLVFTNTILFAQDKTTSTFIFWKPLLFPADDVWGSGNKVGLGIERKLNRKFDLAFNINNGNFTLSSHNVVMSYKKSSIINIDLSTRLVLSRNRIINVFAEVSGNYTTILSFETSYLFYEPENKTFESTRSTYISPCAKVGLRFGRENGRFSTELSVLEYDPFNKGITKGKGSGILKVMLRLK